MTQNQQVSLQQLLQQLQALEGQLSDLQEQNMLQALYDDLKRKYDTLELKLTQKDGQEFDYMNRQLRSRERDWP